MGFLVYCFFTEVNFGLVDMSHIPDWLWFYSMVTYFFLSVLAISTATLFASGIRKATVYRAALGSFILTMAFFLLILMLELMARPLIFI
jgi:hypothetical protein